MTLKTPTASTKIILDATMELYDRIVDPILLVRRLNVAAGHVIPEEEIRSTEPEYEQMDLFTDYEALERERAQQKQTLEKEKRMQKAILEIQKRYGKNAIIKGMNLEEGATALERNAQIGGHKA